MSDGRKRLSGYQYRKNAQDKTAKEQEALKKTVKIEQFFAKTDTVNANIPGTSQKSNEAKATNIVTTEIIYKETIVNDDQLSTEINVLPAYDNDPAKWIINESSRDYFAEHGFKQNKNADFSLSKREYPDQVRFFSPKFFMRELFNGEKTTRAWLIYSVSTCHIFCGPCRLFNMHSQFGGEGFNDWKNLKSRIESHECSDRHKLSVITFKARGNKIGKLDQMLCAQIDEEISYWTKVLKRVVAVVKKLASRGLALRGDDEMIGSSKNGNFLMAIELISEFDPFLFEHIKKYGNPGSGRTNYLSSAIYEEFIQLMSKKSQEVIVSEIKTSKYYSIIVDSTPDMAHVDQLSFVIRYVQECGSPIERFLLFIPNAGHKSQELEKAVKDTLTFLGIDLSNCRGQSYDNANNMSGIYSGLQALIKEINPLADYVPCAAHSLNLVGTHAASCCTEAVTFFGLLQELFCFFTASTHRWEILQSSIKGKLTLKRLSDTRWSARDDACRSLIESWTEIIESLLFIEGDSTEKTVTRSEAKGLRIRLERLETAFMSVFWGSLLDRLNKTSKILQSVDIDIAMVSELYATLINYTQSIRNDFDEYEAKAKLLSGQEEYAQTKSRKRKRKIFVDESQDGDVNNTLDSRDEFRIKTYMVILDNLRVEFEKRCSAYKKLNHIFFALINLRELESIDIRKHALRLCNTYSEDIENTVIDECLHLREQLRLEENMKVHIHDVPKWLRKKGLVELYPNIDIALRIFNSMAATNCSAERSFSCLKRIKTYLRTNMAQDRLNALAILSIESDILERISYDDIIRLFAEKKARRRAL